MKQKNKDHDKPKSKAPEDDEGMCVSCSNMPVPLVSPLSRVRLIEKGTVDCLSRGELPCFCDCWGLCCVSEMPVQTPGSSVTVRHVWRQTEFLWLWTERINLSSTLHPGSGGLGEPSLTHTGQCYSMFPGVWCELGDLWWEDSERSRSAGEDHHHSQLTLPGPRSQPRVQNLSPLTLGLTFLELRLNPRV